MRTVAPGGSYPTLELEFRISNFYKVRDAVRHLNKGETYRGAMKDAITEVIKEALDYVRRITHVQTGALKEAHEMDYDSHRMKGRLYLNRRIVYARGSTLQWPAIYGVYEHARGGSHAFYERTIHEAQHRMATTGMRMLIRRISWP